MELAEAMHYRRYYSWRETMLWKWIMANSVLFAAMFATTVGGILSIVGVVIASRRSLMGQFLVALTEDRKTSQTHDNEVNKQLFDLQNKFIELKAERVNSEDALRRDFAAKEELIRNEVLRYRNENTELIRCNDQLAQEIESMKHERSDIVASNAKRIAEQEERYDKLLQRFNQLQVEHNTLKTQMQKMTSETNGVIGIE
jgi:hypothetical protein